jgi:hypothetical protein
VKGARILVVELFFVQLTLEPAHARNHRYLLPVGELVNRASPRVFFELPLAEILSDHKAVPGMKGITQ